MKQALLEETAVMLLVKGYTIKTLTRTCFDLAARKEDQILLIKILEDANAVSEEFAQEMKTLSSCLEASALIIAEKAGHKLQDSVVYSRFGVYTLNMHTFQNCLNNKFPLAISTKAGLAAKINKEKLKQAMEEESAAEIARKIGVSRRMMQKYEAEQAYISMNKAQAMRKILGDSILDKINIFSAKKEAKQEPKSDIARKYDDLGFESAETRKTPFDIVAKKEKEIVLTGIGDKMHRHLQPLSRLLEADRLIIFRKKKPKDTPALTKKEFLEFEKAKELIKFIKEF